MRRETIHPDYPFTPQEHAAAWVLLGATVRKALVDLEHLRADLASDDDIQNSGDGSWVVKPRVHLTGQYGPALHLAAHILSGGEVLSEPAREAWLAEWTTRLSQSEAEQRLLELRELGESVTVYYDQFRRLLTAGELQ